jgi:hypothetical protein
MKRFSLFSLAGLVLSGLIFLPLAFSQTTNETLTISTYYPSPYGVYNELRLYPKTTPTTCDSLTEGNMYYNSTTDQVMVCRDPSGWQSMSGLWTLNGTNLYPNNTTWNVGIGTTDPLQLKLYLDARVPSPGQVRNGMQIATPRGHYVSIGGGTGTDGSNSAGLHIGNQAGNNIGGEGGTFYYDYDAADRALVAASTGGIRIAALGQFPPAGQNIVFATNISNIERMRITDGGNVGIGTTEPKLPLHIKTTVDGWAMALQGPPSAFTAYGLTSDYITGWGIGMWGKSTAAPTTEDFGIGYYNGASWNIPFVIDKSTGNVGIGTTGPAKNLDVQGGSIRTGGRIGTQNFDPDSGYPSGWGGGIHTWDVYAEGSIKSNYSMFVGGVIGTQGFSPYSGYPSGWGGGVHTWDVWAEGSVGSRNSLVTGNGLLVSWTRPNFFLALQGDRNMVLYDNGVAVWSSGTWVSDIRLKKDVRPLGKTLDKIKGLNAVKFILTNDESNTTQIGLIAQEVEGAFPEVVYTDKNSGYKLIYYDKLSVLLLQAIKDLDRDTFTVLEEQKKEIELLKNEINALKSKQN